MKHTFTVSTWIGDGIDATVTFDYYPGRPGVYSGPPEKCYEDEPDELEVTRVLVDGAEWLQALTEPELEELTNRLYESAWELVESQTHDDREHGEFA
jgi:hypothetical protein